MTCAPPQADSRTSSRLFFFYGTIPIVLSALSIVETLQLGRHSDRLRPLLMVVSASAGVVLWLVQFALEGACTWTVHGGSSVGAFCPVAFSSRYPTRSWSSEEVFVWAMPLLVIIVIFLYASFPSHQHPAQYQHQHQEPGQLQAPSTLFN